MVNLLNLKVIIYHGPNREKNPQVLASHDIVLTTYAIVGREVGMGSQESPDEPAVDDVSVTKLKFQ